MPTHAHYAGEFGAQKMIPKLSKDPAYRAARAEHYANKAHKANIEHAKLVNSGGSKSAIAEHALIAAHALKRSATHAKAAAKLAPGSDHAAYAAAAHQAASRSYSEIEKRVADKKDSVLTPTSSSSSKSGYPNVGKHTLSPESESGPPHVGKELGHSEFASLRQAFKSQLTTAEHEAILAYSDNDYKEINRLLRTGDIKSTSSVSTLVRHIDSAMAKATLPQAAIVYRGTGGASIYGAMSVGDHYVEKGYSSTSAAKNVSNSFNSQVTMHITIPHGGCAAVIPSEHPNEREVLLPRNQKFRVDNIEKWGSRVILHVTAVQE